MTDGFPAEVVDQIVRHMNDDHADDNVLICRALGGQPGATAAHVSGVDADGISFVATVDGRPLPVRIPFSARLTERRQVRAEVIRMHAEAAAAVSTMVAEQPSGGPTLLFLIGPPAVGKMTAGHEIARRTGLRLFHNHLAIEPVLRFFDFGSPPFGRLVDNFRTRLIEEVAASNLPGMIFTYVWAFDVPADRQAVEGYAAPFRRRGGRVLFAELEADQQERLRRNEGESRLAEKPSKRDVEASRRRLLEHDATHRLNSAGEFDGRSDYLRLETTRTAPADAADQIIDHFGLARVPLQ